MRYIDEEARDTADTSECQMVCTMLPTYSGDKHLGEAIDLCLGQIHSNIELVLVNDCSTDSTPEIVKSYSDPRVRYIRREANRLLPEALNTGFWATPMVGRARKAADHLQGVLGGERH